MWINKNKYLYEKRLNQNVIDELKAKVSKLEDENAELEMKTACNDIKIEPSFAQRVVEAEQSRRQSHIEQLAAQRQADHFNPLLGHSISN